ncbi:MAG: DUF3099 domain-containing protein [Pontimonas sp.]
MGSANAVTSLHQSPDDERRSRMVKYSAAMGVRLVCIGLCFVTPGAWLLVPAAGAVLLPYLAVVAANQVTKRGDTAQAYAPAQIVRVDSPKR